MTAVREAVEELHDTLRRIGMVRNGQGLYVRVRGTSAAAYKGVLAKAAKHELETLAGIVERLDKLTAPAPTKYLRLPAQGSVARVVLEVLHVDQLGHDHRGLRGLEGMTDADLAARIDGAGINSVRPRRVELQRAGWVRDSGRSMGKHTLWTLTPAGWRALQGMASQLVTHLMGEDLLDACGTAKPGSLSVTPDRDSVTCLACLQLPVELVASD